MQEGNFTRVVSPFAHQPTNSKMVSYWNKMQCFNFLQNEMARLFVDGPKAFDQNYLGSWTHSGESAVKESFRCNIHLKSLHSLSATEDIIDPTNFLCNMKTSSSRFCRCSSSWQ